jgi:voltage-dependent potassium channel beta subunit
MKYRNLGRSGLSVSEISLGSWLTLGSSVDRAATRELVQAAYDLGINFFDTADAYARGAGEEALGAALKGIPRPYVVIATKCFFPMSDRPNDRGLSRKHIRESTEASLKRLGTDYIDLMQCHRADPSTPMEETVRAFEDLIRQGKLLYWGVSEWRAEQILDACRTADATGGFRPISNQPQYSIARRGIEKAVIPTCVREGLGQVVWSPLAQGALTGKYAGGQLPSGSRATDDQRNSFMQDFLKPAELARVEQLRPFADALGVSMAELALAWCLREPNVSSVIIGATRREQIEQNVKAVEWALSAEDMAEIDKITKG